MKEKIVKHIQQLEEERNIKILMAVESGSRAWGCPSPDSDYDVRIIFKRDKSAYLRIDEESDSIDYFHGELLDINGWDIKKALKLVRKSNVTPFEWAQSPIVYQEIDGFRDRILALCQAYFSPRYAVHHYRGLAFNSFQGADLGTINLKRFFYVLRPIMAAKWIIEKNEVPPMDIPNLLPIIKDNALVAHIDDLLALKLTVGEGYVHPIGSRVVDFVHSEFEILKNTNLEKNQTTLSSNLLNQAFLEIIEG